MSRIFILVCCLATLFFTATASAQSMAPQEPLHNIIYLSQGNPQLDSASQEIKFINADLISSYSGIAKQNVIDKMQQVENLLYFDFDEPSNEFHLIISRFGGRYVLINYFGLLDAEIDPSIQ